jgi:hypothetical protein
MPKFDFKAELDAEFGTQPNWQTPEAKQALIVVKQAFDAGYSLFAALDTASQLEKDTYTSLCMAFAQGCAARHIEIIEIKSESERN